MNTLKVALIGCGQMGESLIRSLAEIDSVRLVAVFDPVPEQAVRLGAALQVLAVDELAKILADDGVDGIIAASPPFTHPQVCIAAAEAEKHVFVEKPLATNVRDCDAIIEAAERARIKLMVGQVCRYHPVQQTVKQMVDQGAVGSPVFIHVRRLHGPLLSDHPSNHWRLRREKSGGALMEYNAHEIDFMRNVCGEVESVFATGGSYLNHDADYPDLAAVTIRFRSGAVGFLHSSFVSAINGFGGRLDGTDGTLEFPAWGNDQTIHHKRFGAEVESISVSDPQRPGPLVAELAAWIEAIRSDREPPITGADGRAAVQIAEAAYRSMETGKPVALVEV